MKKKMNIPPVLPDAFVPQADFEITLQGYTQYADQPRTLLTYKTDAITLQEVLPAVEDFLRGMGYAIDGHLEIVDEETAQ